MEHVERAGVHSGDSIAVYPPQTLSSKVIYTIIDYTKRLALSLHVKGLLNIQFVVVDGEVYIIEVNPRSSRTVPFLSKVTNVDMVGIATRIAMVHLKGTRLQSPRYRARRSRTSPSRAQSFLREDDGCRHRPRT